MKKFVILFSVLVFFIACQQKDEQVAKKSMPKSITYTADSTNSSFHLKGEYFTAKFRQVSAELRGSANGPTYWQRAGSLYYVLSELYGSPVELVNKPDLNSHYNLTLDWDEQTTIEKTGQLAAKKIKEFLGYAVKTETRMESRYVLSLEDSSKLKNNTDTDFIKDGVNYKVSLKNGDWKMYVPLQRFSDILSKKTGETIYLNKDYGSKAYYFELTYNGDFDELVNELQEKYGVTIQKKTVPVEYHIIDFG